MNKFKILTTAFLTLVLGSTVAVGVSSNVDSKAIKTDAATAVYSGERVYLDTSNWGYGDARYAVYCWNSTTNWWVDMKQVNSGDNKLVVAKSLYSTSTPSQTPTGFKFVRLNGSNPANNWSNKWNESGDYSFGTSTNKAIACLTDKNKFSNNGWWDTWTHKATEFLDYKREIIDPDAGDDLVRIWVDRGEYKTYGYDYVFHCWTDGNTTDPFDYQYCLTDYYNTHFDDYYICFDIPVKCFTTSGVKFQFKIYSATTELYETKSENTDNTLSYEGGKIFYVNSETNITRGTVGDELTSDSDDYSILASVLEAYDSCSDSAYNGYNAYNDLVEVWNLNPDNAKYSEVTLIDKEYDDKTEWTVAEKAAELRYRYTLNGGSGLSNKLISFNDTSSMNIFAIIAVISVVTLGAAFIVIKKRKQASK